MNVEMCGNPGEVLTSGSFPRRLKQGLGCFCAPSPRCGSDVIVLETATRRIEPTLAEDRDRVYRAERSEYRFRPACIHKTKDVDQNSASWNRITGWLRAIDSLRNAA